MCTLIFLAWKLPPPPEFRPGIYKRYIDGTFLLFQNINQIEKLKYYLNLQHANIMFTPETEMDKSLSFLDIKIVRENNKFTIASLHSVVCLLTLRVLYLPWY